jgi:hypothetical protein
LEQQGDRGGKVVPHRRRTRGRYFGSFFRALSDFPAKYQVRAYAMNLILE